MVVVVVVVVVVDEVVLDVVELVVEELVSPFSSGGTKLLLSFEQAVRPSVCGNVKAG